MANASTTNNQGPNGQIADIDILRADIEALRASLSDLTGNLRQTGRDGARLAAGEARAAARKAGNALEEGAGRFGDMVKERPALACSLALGLGTLIGAALVRRRG
jgi:hypothetical protein